MGEGSSKRVVEIDKWIEEKENAGNDESSDLQLGLFLGRCRGGSNGRVDRAVGSAAPEADAGRRVSREINRPELELAIGHSRYLERYGSLNSSQEGIREILGDFDWLSQEEDELYLGSERANSNRDFQYKRAKVLFHPE